MLFGILTSIYLGLIKHKCNGMGSTVQRHGKVNGSIVCWTFIALLILNDLVAIFFSFFTPLGFLLVVVQIEIDSLNTHTHSKTHTLPTDTHTKHASKRETVCLKHRDV